MASRTTTAARPRPSGGRASASRPARATASTSKAKPAPKAPKGPSGLSRAALAAGAALGRLLQGLGTLLGKLWLAAAHSVGGATRAATGGAKELDPAHR
ncbi:MAG: hypothetical protein JWN57_2723, partial [Frankiales bacterium]|nr:hypothetical protein [Frankiales bacterium]